jgi:primosomal protein N' (replication factor Y)
LDRPFTYRLDAELDAGVGSLVQVPFHGRAVRGWVLGPTDDLPPRMLPVRKVVSTVRYFDPLLLRTLRWTAERYVAPLAAVIARSHPPRVASEESAFEPAEERRRSAAASRKGGTSVLDGYRGGDRLLETVARRSGAFLLRPAPEDEIAIVIELVRACVAGGRRAVVVVPEARPVPATANQILQLSEIRTVAMLGGDRRTRYRAWLDARDADVVVGTRPTVLAPMRPLGLIVVCREGHPGHREDRSPYHNAREVAFVRAANEGAACVLTAISASVEAAGSGVEVVEPASRRWPPVQVVKPPPVGHPSQLVRAMERTRRGFVLSLVPGAGVAEICRSCGAPAACARCGGWIRLTEGELVCAVCQAPGTCAMCGSQDLAVRPGGRERLEDWISRTAKVKVRRGTPSREGEGCWVGGAEAVRDTGSLGLDTVAILDVSLAEGRTGIGGRERILTTMMETVAWARPDGSAIVQAARAADPFVQALVRGNPRTFIEEERRRRSEAGFPAGSAIFRVTGDGSLAERLAKVEPTTILETVRDGSTVCLLALDRERVGEFGALARSLAAEGIITRVQADPHLEER